ncbi:MAG: hypothetical protein DRN27_00320 [Thermoplasmata archaeon]|nr:MAG: hypothetical protein DRN27_00320 [Thermoplasmata archaeon]
MTYKEECFSCNKFDKSIKILRSQIKKSDIGPKVVKTREDKKSFDHKREVNRLRVRRWLSQKRNG